MTVAALVSLALWLAICGIGWVVMKAFEALTKVLNWMSP